MHTEIRHFDSRKTLTTELKRVLIDASMLVQTRRQGSLRNLQSQLTFSPGHPEVCRYHTGCALAWTKKRYVCQSVHIHLSALQPVCPSAQRLGNVQREKNLCSEQKGSLCQIRFPKNNPLNNQERKPLSFGKIHFICETRKRHSIKYGIPLF